MRARAGGCTERFDSCLFHRLQLGKPDAHGCSSSVGALLLLIARRETPAMGWRPLSPEVFTMPSKYVVSVILRLWLTVVPSSARAARQSSEERPRDRATSGPGGAGRHKPSPALSAAFGPAWSIRCTFSFVPPIDRLPKIGDQMTDFRFSYTCIAEGRRPDVELGGRHYQL